MLDQSETRALSPDEVAQLVTLSATDNELFSRTFFPNTVRQEFAPFHNDVWARLESNNRLVSLLMFRGSAKTSISRIYTAKRIAYNISRTILYIGKSEGHAIRSLDWIRKQVDFNRTFSRVFNLSPGKRWNASEAEIMHGIDNQPITLLGMGITGSTRGINIDDWRPDLIVLDDPLDEENSATKEQREKIKDLIYGSLKQSLAPTTEAPDAKLVFSQTPLNREDAAMETIGDPSWNTAVYPCWTPETMDLPTEMQESAWPARFLTKELQADKLSHIARNKVSVWNREMECRITSPETTSFKPEWLHYYGDSLPENMTTVMVIDPVPPPSDKQIAQGFAKKDYEAFSVVGKFGGDYFLLEYSLNRGHEPNWTVNEFFRLGIKYRPRTVLVESVAYQRTLSWLLKQAMNVRREYFVIKETDDKRKKFDKIVDGLSGVASTGHLWAHPSQEEFISQFQQYPDVSHDDLIETVALGVTELEGKGYKGQDDDAIYKSLQEADRDLERLTYQRGAP